MAFVESTLFFLSKVLLMRALLQNNNIIVSVSPIDQV